MPIHNLFSKRRKSLSENVQDVYIYDQIPQKFRNQVIQIILENLGNDNYEINNGLNQVSRSIGYYNPVENLYERIVKILYNEYGVFSLIKYDVFEEKNFSKELFSFIHDEEDIEKVLDAIEITFSIISNEINSIVINDLNERFKENDVGYQFVNNQIIRIDDSFIHKETIKPALLLLNNSEYKGAQQEFFSAFEHYKNGKNKEALNDCLKSFESVMKSICDKRNWFYEKDKATSKQLIKTCMDNQLIPSFWQNSFNSLSSLLESSVPTGRNKLSGHGQGSDIVNVPDYMVSYMINMTASTLLFLIKAEKNLL